ncbi:MAG: hypothetical protein JWM11_4742 [Planctomycetaceae bacterium]|nr:hypothetical protein [Planctomycetaceae bacterium]
MFGWFRPVCPVDRCTKSWIEERLAWLASEFGGDVFSRRAVVFPDEDFFPDKYDQSEKSVRVLLDRVCTYMDANPDHVELRLFSNPVDFGLVNENGHAVPMAAGWYEEQNRRTIIRLEKSQLGDRMSLIGTMAHELAHLRLLGERRVFPDIFDNELLTDLTVVFHGLGIFLANVPRVYQSQFSHWLGTNVRRPEYMSYPMFGYALAHAACFRNERKPEWMAHLGMDARYAFKQGLRYLWETEDSTFRPRRPKK